MMLVKYNTYLRSIDVQERNLLFIGLFSFVDVCLKIRKEGFYRKSLVLLVSSKDFEPKKEGFYWKLLVLLVSSKDFKPN